MIEPVEEVTSDCEEDCCSLDILRLSVLYPGEGARFGVNRSSRQQSLHKTGESHEFDYKSSCDIPHLQPMPERKCELWPRMSLYYPKLGMVVLYLRYLSTRKNVWGRRLEANMKCIRLLKYLGIYVPRISTTGSSPQGKSCRGAVCLGPDSGKESVPQRVTIYENLDSWCCQTSASNRYTLSKFLSVESNMWEEAHMRQTDYRHVPST